MFMQWERTDHTNTRGELTLGNLGLAYLQNRVNAF